MHIAFISSDYIGATAFDRDTALIHAIEGLGVKVTVVVPEVSPVTILARLRSRLLPRLGYNVSTQYDAPRLRNFARYIEKALSGTEVDIIFSRSPRFSAWLNTPLPVVNWFDAPFVCIENLYSGFTRLDAMSRWAGHSASSRALRRSNLTLLMSFWAADKAIRRYHDTESRIGVVQAPAILPAEPPRSEVLAARTVSRKAIKCLIVGNDWQRKGADIALEGVRKVREMGVEIHLTTIGMDAPPQLSPEPWLRILPPLQKGLPDEYAKFRQEFLGSDIFILPSRADFTPHAISEAYAFGLPTIASSVGAIPEMIEHGQTGFVTQRIDNADEYAQCLFRLATEPGLLSHMAIESRNKYEAEFALPVVARKMVAHLESVVYRSRKG